MLMKTNSIRTYPKLSERHGKRNSTQSGECIGCGNDFWNEGALKQTPEDGLATGGDPITPEWKEK